MRAGRLLSILLLLQANRRLTAGQLAERLEVSPRTVYRDMVALGVAGVPVYAERGTGGGWSLVDGYRTDLTGLDEAEVRALFLASPPRLLADLGLHEAADAALIKLLAALPSGQRRDAESARRRVHADSSGWDRPPESVPHLRTLREAVERERKIHLAYRRADGTAVERLVDPLGLVAKGSVWYLVAAVDGETRTYRVSRVEDVRVTDEPYAPPDGFDLAAYWDEWLARFRAELPRYMVTLRIAPAMLTRVRQPGWPLRLRIELEDPPDEDGWVRLTARFDVEDEACAAVLGFGPDAEILEPPELRRRVVELARGIIARYGDRAARG